MSSCTRLTWLADECRAVHQADLVPLVLCVGGTIHFSLLCRHFPVAGGAVYGSLFCVVSYFSVQDKNISRSKGIKLAELNAIVHS